MCRMYGSISNEPSKVDCSLVFAQNALLLQSRVDEIGLDHTDGWGIATYEDGVPTIRKKTTAAYEDNLFSLTAEKVYSTAIIAHIRRATVGKASIENTHPFMSGNWTFAHNGTVSGFAEIRHRMESETRADLQSQRKGDTDSEQYFLWLLSGLGEAGIEKFSDQPAEKIQTVLQTQVKHLEAACLAAEPEKIPRLNFVLTDGVVMAACRWNHSLHLVRREGLYECEICGIPHIHHHETVDYRAVAIASEPITHEQWQEVPNKSVVVEAV